MIVRGEGGIRRLPKFYSILFKSDDEKWSQLDWKEPQKRTILSLVLSLMPSFLDRWNSYLADLRMKFEMKFDETDVSISGACSVVGKELSHHRTKPSEAPATAPYA